LQQPDLSSQASGYTRIQFTHYRTESIILSAETFTIVEPLRTSFSERTPNKARLCAIEVSDQRPFDIRTIECFYQDAVEPLGLRADDLCQPLLFVLSELTRPDQAYQRYSSVSLSYPGLAKTRTSHAADASFNRTDAVTLPFLSIFCSSSLTQRGRTRFEHKSSPDPAYCHWCKVHHILLYIAVGNYMFSRSRSPCPLHSPPTPGAYPSMRCIASHTRICDTTSGPTVRESRCYGGCRISSTSVQELQPSPDNPLDALA